MTQSKALITSLSVLVFLAACSKQSETVQKPKSTSIEAPQKPAEPGPVAAPAVASDAFATLSTQEQEKILRQSFDPLMVELSDYALVPAQHEQSYREYMALIHNNSDLLKDIKSHYIKFLPNLSDEVSSPARSVSETVNPLRKDQTTLTVKICPTGDQESDDAFVKEAIGMAKRYQTIEEKLWTRITLRQNDFVQSYPITVEDLKTMNNALEEMVNVSRITVFLGVIDRLRPKVVSLGSSTATSDAARYSPGPKRSTLWLNLSKTPGAMVDDLFVIEGKMNGHDEATLRALLRR